MTLERWKTHTASPRIILVYNLEGFRSSARRRRTQKGLADSLSCGHGPESLGKNKVARREVQRGQQHRERTLMIYIQRLPSVFSWVLMSTCEETAGAGKESAGRISGNSVQHSYVAQSSSLFPTSRHGNLMIHGASPTQQELASWWGVISPRLSVSLFPPHLKRWQRIKQ